MGMSRKAMASEAARLLSALGASKGGKASAAALTAEERVARARNAIAARWKGHKGLPVDQASVMARLARKGPEPVTLRIAPGDGGKRRRTAIEALAKAGRLRVVDAGPDSVTVASK